MTVPAAPLSREIHDAIAEAGGPISFADFMRLALYHPAYGYYRKSGKRIGFCKESDFFTATSTGGVFGELVLEACSRLLEPEDLSGFTFVEIGAEPERSVLPKCHPFRDSLVLRHGDPFGIPKKAIVFSNELFDAQPFHRLMFRGGAWREMGVNWSDGFVEAPMPGFSRSVKKRADILPSQAPEGCRIDMPAEAEDLLGTIVSASSWRGLILVFDYGKSWRELIDETPQGTARAYHRHRQSNDLLSSPGENDLTCHICWDWMKESLAQNGFSEISLKSQEAFFVRHAFAAIEAIATAQPESFDPRRQTLQQLLHPGNMGQKFQVLSARRR